MSTPAKPAQAVHRLGRGLSSLIGTSLAPDPAPVQGPPPAAVPAGRAPGDEEARIHPGRRSEIPIDRITPNPHQPRRQFDQAELAELAASIAQQGILQPILVAPRPTAADGASYVLVAGERRLRAARAAGLRTVPCVVREATDQQLLEWSLIENIQRADLNPLERAQAYRSYIDRFGLTQAEVAERTGEARASVANYLRLLDLPDRVQAMLLDGSLSFGHAKALAALAGQEACQVVLAERVSRQGLSVRQAEALVASRTQEGVEATPSRRAGAKPPYLADLEARLSSLVGTRVTILPGRAKSTGRLVIDYYSLDDFDRIAGALGLKALE